MVCCKPVLSFKIDQFYSLLQLTIIYSPSFPCYISCHKLTAHTVYAILISQF